VKTDPEEVEAAEAASVEEEAAVAAEGKHNSINGQILIFSSVAEDIEVKEVKVKKLKPLKPVLKKSKKVKLPNKELPESVNDDAKRDIIVFCKVSYQALRIMNFRN
jgi:hypothetical protein